MIARVQVLGAIRIPAGEVLDGNTLAESVVLNEGRHDISHALIVANEWAETGRVEIEQIDGKPVHWGPCCESHNASAT